MTTLNTVDYSHLHLSAASIPPGTGLDPVAMVEASLTQNQAFYDMYSQVPGQTTQATQGQALEDMTGQGQTGTYYDRNQLRSRRGKRARSPGNGRSGRRGTSYYDDVPQNQDVTSAIGNSMNAQSDACLHTQGQGMKNVMNQEGS